MTRTIAILSLLVLNSPLALAHFPWLSADRKGKVTFCFGETPAETSYKLPDAMAKAEVVRLGKDGEISKVALKKVETDDFIGLASEEPVRATMLMSKLTYGMYAGSRLDYYAVHQAGPLPKSRKTYVAKSGGNKKKSEKAQAPILDLQAQLVDTDQGVDVFVTWKGKPIADADVTLFCEDGHEEGAAKTDQEGKVSFTDREVEDGLNRVMVGHQLEKVSGELGGKPYTSSSHYLTVTFHDPQDFE